MTLHGRLWRRVAIGTLLLLTYLLATLAPDPPPIDPARIFEQLEGASSELVSDLRPSQSFPSGIRQEGSSSSAISRAVGRKKGRKGESQPPRPYMNRDRSRYRIETPGGTLGATLVLEIERRASQIGFPGDLGDIRFTPAHKLLDESGQLPQELVKQIASVIATASKTDHSPFVPIVARYHIGPVTYTIQHIRMRSFSNFQTFNTVATVRQDTKLVDLAFLGQLQLSNGLVEASRNQKENDLAAARSAALERIRVDSANFRPGGVGTALQHNDAVRRVENVRPLVRPNEHPRLHLNDRPRLNLNERPPFDLNELPHEYESGEDA